MKTAQSLTAVVAIALLGACSSSSSAPVTPEAAAPDAAAPAPAAPPADPTGWELTGSLRTARFAHSATLLPDGRVLVAGGEDVAHVPLASAELYDPETGTWQSTAPMPAPRTNHIAVLLKSGKVLIAGGGRNTPIGQPLGGPEVTRSSLLYDPTTGVFSPTGDLAERRSHLREVLLPSGKVLVTGGAGVEQSSPADCKGSPYCGPYGRALATAEIYDPDSGTWSLASPMSTRRFSFTLTPLATGEALAVGGTNEGAEGTVTTEIFDPRTTAWRAGPNLNGPPREHHSATLLGNGTVLVVGGKNPNVTPLKSAQLLDAAHAKWTDLAPLADVQTVPGLATLASGRGLVAGGYNQLKQKSLSSTHLLDGDAPAWQALRGFKEERAWQTMTLLKDGRVLAAGGISSDSVEMKTCELSTTE